MRNARGFLATVVALGLSFAVLPGCDSGPLKPDGGQQSGTAGTTGSAGGTAGTTGTAGTGGAGTLGSGGKTGAAGRGNDGGAAGTGGGSCVCTDIYLPVCGVDGTTYPSDCTAACAGVAVAHTGACATAPADAGADSGLGGCDQDSDCAYRMTGTCSCAGACVPKTDPVPAPPKYMCDIACPLVIPACACVKHQCGVATVSP